MRLADIPEHLHHLERTPTGMPIPWINLREHKGVDDPEKLFIKWDRYVGGIASYYREDPDAPADLTRQAPQRQRASMVAGRCQVCTRPVDWGFRALPVSTFSTEVIEFDGQVMYVVNEPWLCPDCAHFAAKICPGLIRRRTKEDLWFVPIASPEECTLIVSSGWIDGPYEEATKADNVYMWVKVSIKEEAWANRVKAEV